MKIESIKTLAIPEIKVIRFARFTDHRGYFTESFSKRDFAPLKDEVGEWNIVQVNESYSKTNTIRGLHFQWNPFMGKLVRTVQGHMIDLILDIRKGSSTFGKLIAYDMPSSLNNDWNECIWVPPGFAHGNIFLEDTLIQYLCSGEYSQGCEAGISPYANDIDWSICDMDMIEIFNWVRKQEDVKITDKDINGLSLKKWLLNNNSNFFKYK